MKGSKTPKWRWEERSLRPRLQPCDMSFWVVGPTRVFLPAFYRTTGRSASCGMLFRRIDPALDIHPLSRKGEPWPFWSSASRSLSASGWAVEAAVRAPEHSHGAESISRKWRASRGFHDPKGPRPSGWGRVAPFSCCVNEVSRHGWAFHPTGLGHPLRPRSLVAWAPPTKSALGKGSLRSFFCP